MLARGRDVSLPRRLFLALRGVLALVRGAPRWARPCAQQLARGAGDLPRGSASTQTFGRGAPLEACADDTCSLEMKSEIELQWKS